MAETKSRARKPRVKKPDIPGEDLDTTSPLLFVMFAALVYYLVDYSETIHLKNIGGGRPHPNKPFPSFSHFYPFYLKEHSDNICRRFHFVGTSIVMLILVRWPRTAVAMLGAACAGNMAVHFFARFSTGIPEAIIVVFLYVSLTGYLNKSAKPALATMLAGYGFAWVGHFFFELNRPATFIYPTYSLMGDFRMWYDMIVGNVSF